MYLSFPFSIVELWNLEHLIIRRSQKLFNFNILFSFSLTHFRVNSFGLPTDYICITMIDHRNKLKEIEHGSNPLECWYFVWEDIFYALLHPSSESVMLIEELCVTDFKKMFSLLKFSYFNPQVWSWLLFPPF